MSLRARILGLFALVSCLSVLLGMLAAGVEARRTLREELSAALQGGAQSVRGAYEDLPRSDHPRRDLVQLTGTFSGSRHVRARLLDGRGVVIARSTPTDPEVSAPAWFVDAFASDLEPVRLPAPATAAGPAVVVLEPLFGPDVAAAWREAVRAAVFLLATVALGLALAWMAIRAALRPVSRLSTALSRIGEGDFEARVVEEGPAELLPLQRALNHMGDQLAAVRARNRLLEDQLATIQDEERSEIARDLHDEIGPHLFSATVDARIAADLVEGPHAAEARERLAALQEAVRRIQAVVRDLIVRLKPSPPAELGLARAIEDVVAFWSGRRPAVRFELEIMDEDGLDDAVKDAAFRVAQEAVSNAMRHASPTRVTIAVRPAGPGTLEVCVADDGGPAGGAPGGGFGLKNMRERAESLGGDFNVQKSGAGREGWRVQVRLPRAPARRALEAATS